MQDMPTNSIAQVFNPYDLFGKAFPGMVFMIGLISLLPTGGNGIVLPSSPVLIAVLILAFIIISFAIGQSVHSIAVLFENKLYRVALLYFFIIFSFKVMIYMFIPKIRGSSESLPGIEEEFGQLIPIAATMLILLLAVIGAGLAYVGEYSILTSLIIAGVISLVLPRDFVRSWGGMALNPHRRIFRLFVTERVTPPAGIKLVNKFRNKANSRYPDSFDWQDTEDLNTIYVLVTSRLEYETDGRAKMFQAILAFCRTTWFVLMIYSASYLLLWYHNTVFNIHTFVEYTPVIFETGFSPDVLPFFSGVLIVGVLILLEGERQNKIHFATYLMADFINIEIQDQTAS